MAKAQQQVQILTDRASGAALGGLTGGVAVAVEQTHGTGLLQSFLMKKIKGTASIEGLTAGEGAHLVLGLARGDASIGEIKAALEDAQLERDKKTQAAKRDVLHETIVAMNISAILNTRTMLIEFEMSIGGGKGIPFEDGDGWQWFVYNGGSTLTTGATFSSRMTYWGIWL